MGKQATPELEHIGQLLFPDFEKSTPDLRRLRTICVLLLEEVSRLSKEVQVLRDQTNCLDTRTVGMVRLGGS